jgi:MFS family permease
MAALDTLVVSTSLSAIRLDLGASIEDLEWTVNAYNLSFAVLLITAAALGDRYGRRAFYAAGLGLFAAASAAAALAPSIGFLVAARAAQGAGAALVLTLLTAAFPPEKRGAAIGLFSAVTSMMHELGGVFGIAVFAGAGSYASSDAFLDGFAPAVAVLAGFSALGAIVALALPGRRATAESLHVGPVPALESARGS